MCCVSLCVWCGWARVRALPGRPGVWLSGASDGKSRQRERRTWAIQLIRLASRCPSHARPFCHVWHGRTGRGAGKRRLYVVDFSTFVPCNIRSQPSFLALWTASCRGRQVSGETKHKARRLSLAYNPHRRRRKRLNYINPQRQAASCRAVGGRAIRYNGKPARSRAPAIGGLRD